jgi:hypothetical protein
MQSAGGRDCKTEPKLGDKREQREGIKAGERAGCVGGVGENSRRFPMQRP